MNTLQNIQYGELINTLQEEEVVAPSINGVLAVFNLTGQYRYYNINFHFLAPRTSKYYQMHFGNLY